MPYTKNTLISEVQNDSVFKGNGRLLFPVDYGYMSGNRLGNINLPWFNYLNPDKTVEVLNYLHDQAENGKPYFLDIYSKEEKQRDPSKENTGLYFFQGKPYEKFAIVNAGGGFCYVGAIHDSFPIALELSKKGYNVFALIYRSGINTALEDLARTLAVIDMNADNLKINPNNYSLWGGSAGGRMTAYMSSLGPSYFGYPNLNKPAAAITNYTGHSNFSYDDTPTFSAVGTKDSIANWRVMQNRLKAMEQYGIPTSSHLYPGLRHGFGLALGTDAEGWVDDAVEFWEEQVNS